MTQVLAMPTRPSKRKLDELESNNTLATQIVAQTTGMQTSQPPERVKNAAAVALGKLGASKGGKARAKKLSAKRRKEIAKTAALSRWQGPKTTAQT